MIFVRPWALLLLLLVIPLCLLHKKGKNTNWHVRRWALLPIRLILLTALVLALAQPIVFQSAQTPTIVAVIDISASISDDNLLTAGQLLKQYFEDNDPQAKLHIVLFGSQVFLTDTNLSDMLNHEVLPALRKRFIEAKEGPNLLTGTSLAEALTFAGTIIPSGSTGKVLLFTDGRETRGDALKSAAQLARRDIPVITFPLGAAKSGEVSLFQVSMPASAAAGSTVIVQAMIDSSLSGTSRLTISSNNDVVQTEQIETIQPGLQTVDLRLPLELRGLQSFTVKVETDNDFRQDNNQLSTSIYVTAPLNVSVIESDLNKPAAQALAHWLGISAKVKSLSPASLTSDLLKQTDLLVIADVPAAEINDSIQQQVRVAVLNGMGLLVSGGRRAFGPGGYCNTTLETVLPVVSAQTVERRDPSATLVIIIDTSGSMGGGRIDLAKETARLAMRHLKPHDKIGIVEFYGAKHWAAPIQPASNAIDLQRALNRLNAGGGTVILPAIEEAYYALLNIQTRTRHVLVLTDGGVESGQFEPLLQKMSDRGMTVSTVLVGPGTHSAFLASLAEWGGGRFYWAPDRFNIPEIIIKQPESSPMSPFIEQPTKLVTHSRNQILTDMDLASLPSINGYLNIRAKPTADILIESATGRPLLASWQFGLGKVGAFGSQLAGDWTVELAQHPSYLVLIANLARHLAALPPEQRLRIQPVIHNDIATVDITKVSSDSNNAFEQLELTIVDSALNTSHTILDPIRPNQWNLLADKLSPGVYQLQAYLPESRYSAHAAFCIAPQREFASIAPNQKLLNRIENVSEVLDTQPELPAFQGFSELWPFCVIVGLLTFLADILVRRLPLRSTAVAVLFLAGGFGTSLDAASEQNNLPEINPHAEISALVDEALRITNQDESLQVFREACRKAWVADGVLTAVASDLQKARPGFRTDFLSCNLALENNDLENAYERLRVLSQQPNADYRVQAQLAQVAEMIGHDQIALDTLNELIKADLPPEVMFSQSIRKAQILYDSGQMDQARQCLLETAQQLDSPQHTDFCLHLAALNQDYDTAVVLQQEIPTEDKTFTDLLFEGLFLLRDNQYDKALQTYQEARDAAAKKRDHRYVTERIIAAARAGGHLSELADEWYNAGNLSADDLHALSTILRELGRTDEVLQILVPNHLAASQDVLASETLQRVAIDCAVETGHIDQAESIYLSLLNQDPHRIEYLTALARLRLLDNRREEARRLFDEQIKINSNAEILLDLAEGARQVAFYDLAQCAADKVDRNNAASRLEARLFLAKLLRDQGDTEGALRMLDQAHDAAQADARSLTRVAQALERLDNHSRALQIYNEIYELSRGEDILWKIAAVEERLGKVDCAYERWYQIWQKVENPSRQRQAQQRLLDLAARTGRLADLAVELEDKLDSDTGGNRELDMLVDIYSTANDPIAAAEILHEFALNQQDKVGTLNKLVRVHLNSEQFGRSYRLLDELIRLDPQNAADYLQQMAIIAIERQQPRQARDVLERFAQYVPSGQMADEFAAGVLGLIGEHQQAAQHYARMLARFPDRIEAWLLWARELKEAGQAKQALAAFQIMLSEAVEDDLFTVCVDGLLNLEASPRVLKWTLRQAKIRIASKPGRVYLYRLAADLHDGLGHSNEIIAILEQAVVVAGERRPAFLRELINVAKSQNNIEKQIDFGRTVIALGEQMPPQVFTDLGEAFLQAGEPASADRSFSLAAANGDSTRVKLLIADSYERTGASPMAERIIRELLVGKPDDVELLQKSGTLLEQLDRYDDAFVRYLHAVDIMIERQFRHVHTASDTTSVSQTLGVRHLRHRISANYDEFKLFFDATLDGLISSARDESSQCRLIDHFNDRFKQELVALPTPAAGERLDTYPRLSQLARTMRLLGLAMHRCDVADSCDRALIQRFPEDTLLAKTIIDTRINWGLPHRARTFLEDQIENELPIEIAIANMIGPEQTPVILPPDRPINNQQLERLLPFLLFAGRDDQVRETIHRWLNDNSLSLTPNTARVCTVAAVALADEQLILDATLTWIDAARNAGTQRQILDNLTQCIHLTWHIFDQKQHAILINRMLRTRDNAVSSSREIYNRIIYQLAESFDAAMWTDMATLRHDICLASSTPVAELARLMQSSPPADRPSLLHDMVKNRPEDQRRISLLQLAGALRFEPAPELSTAILDIFRQSPPYKLNPDKIYSQLRRDQWLSNRNAAKLCMELGEQLLVEQPDNPAIWACTALVRAHAGFYGQALTSAREALDYLLSARQLSASDCEMLEDLVFMITPEDRKDMVAGLRKRKMFEGVTAPLAFAEGLFLQSLGDNNEARPAFQQAFQLAPQNQEITERVMTSFEQEGMYAPLAELLDNHLTSSGTMQTSTWGKVAQLRINTGNPLAALTAARHSGSPLGPVQVMNAYLQMGRCDKVRSTLVSYKTACRNELRFYSPLWPESPSPGGLKGYLQELQKKTQGREQRIRLFEALAECPFTLREYQAFLLPASPNRGDIAGLIPALAASILHNDVQSYLQEFRSLYEKKLLNRKDRAVLFALAAHDSHLIDEFPLVLNNIIADTDPEDTRALTILAQLYFDQGYSVSTNRIMRWVMAWNQLQGHSHEEWRERLAQIDIYLDTLPLRQRDNFHVTMLNRLTPTPLDQVDDELEQERLTRLLSLNQASILSQIESYRQSALTNPSQKLRQVWTCIARFDAANHQADNYAKMVSLILRPEKYAPLDSEVFDIRLLLPETPDPANPTWHLEIVLEELEQLHNTNKLGTVRYINYLCLLAEWAHSSKLEYVADSILERLEPFSCRLGQHSLWIADIAEKLGKHDMSLHLLESLFQADMLGISRMSKLLDTLVTSGDIDVAVELAQHAARFSNHPTVLSILTRAASDAGDTGLITEKNRKSP